MHKVIVERPRIGSRMPNHATRLRVSNQADFEEFDRVPRRIRRDDGKTLNENLAPLRRFIEKQVNRPWNKVYQEIVAGIDARSVTGFHVLQHVPDFVRVNTYMHHGEVWASYFTISGPVWGLYVHPLTGILRRAKHDRPQWFRRRPQGPSADPVIRESDDVWFTRTNGLWYRVERRRRNPGDAWMMPDGRLLGGEFETVRRQCDGRQSAALEGKISG
ncbi:MAG: hypothetical protein FJW39_00970 [Acidobacteria bacterium]|nr:hypothetical protein [Acidobacteriota bacterium]